MRDLIKVYLDNNIYNYMVDPQKISSDEVNQILSAIKKKKLQVLFSPVNLVEIVRCYESKKLKARNMIDLSVNLSPTRIAKEPKEILLDGLYTYKNHTSIPNPISTSDTLFDQIRDGLSRNPNYPVPEEFHNRVNDWDREYIQSIKVMKQEITKMLREVNPDKSNARKNPVDFYIFFNSNAESRDLFVEAIFKDRCKYRGTISHISSFDRIENLEIFLQFYFKISYEYLVKRKDPKTGDYADLDQTVYFGYVDYVVTSDTGKAGLFPNYRKIVNEVIQRKGKNAIKFKTLIKKLQYCKAI